MKPVHPGEILFFEFMEPLGVSQYALSEAMGVCSSRVNGIVNGRRRISADTALRLADYFKNSPEFWMNLQAKYDLEMARR